MFAFNKFESGAEADDADGIISAAVAFLFLVPADEEGRERDAGFDVECADADGPADFMGTEGGVVEIELFNVERDFPEGLSEVGMKIGVAAVGNEGLLPIGDGGEEVRVGRSGFMREFWKREEVASFVICEHERIEFRELFPRDGFCEFDDGMMLEGGGFDFMSGESPEDGIVRFGRAGSENDFRGVGVDEFGEEGAGMFDFVQSEMAGGMEGGGVSEEAGFRFVHFSTDFREKGGRCGVVEVGHLG